MNITVKHQVILSRALTAGGVTSFIADDDASDADARKPLIVMIDTRLYEDMGSPEQITVTVQPGDLLNDPSDEGN